MAKFVALLLVLLSTSPLVALGDEAPTAQAALEQRLARLNAEQVSSSKLGGETRDKLWKQRREVQNLIKRIQAGEAVDPKEIDRVLGSRVPVYVERKGQ